MNCELYDDLLTEYVDGVRAADRQGDARFAAFERHLAQCGRCQMVVADFTAIREAASALDEHVPPPRLWAKIASAIETQQLRPWWQRPFAGATSPWVPIAAAALLAILTGGASWIAWRQAAVETPQQQASAPSSDTALPLPADQHYEEAIAGLQRLADAQNASLDPKTRAVLTANLAVIDRAINESRAALAQEPASALAQESLLEALDTKVALLQDTVALASDAGGLPEDAAAASKEVNQ
jgi:hypothetical protein